jgi:hypothetical protein
MKTRLSLLLCAAVLSAPGFSKPLKIELPPETAGFKPGPGAELATGQCLACHSAEYITTQPPMPASFWKASIEKMQKKYGAQISPDQTQALVEYFAQSSANPDRR